MINWRCCSCWLVVVVASVALVSPARAASSTTVPLTTKAAPADSDDAYSDPSRSLGATSPSCRYALPGTARASCRASGSVAQPHPLSSYGIDVRVGFSITDPGKSFLAALQMLGAALWMALLYVVKGVLLLLEWAFSLDLTNEGMPQVRRSLTRLHDQAFGDWWLLLGISLAGLWGIYRGLVQRRTTETLTGLAATVALMIAGLVLISEPDDTVGWAARATNEAGMAVLAAGTGGRAEGPRGALASSMRQVFDTSVRQPWCALQFGSVEFCEVRTGDPSRSTNAALAGLSRAGVATRAAAQVDERRRRRRRSTGPAGRRQGRLRLRRRTQAARRRGGARGQGAGAREHSGGRRDLPAPGVVGNHLGRVDRRDRHVRLPRRSADPRCRPEPRSSAPGAGHAARPGTRRQRPRDVPSVVEAPAGCGGRQVRLRGLLDGGPRRGRRLRQP